MKIFKSAEFSKHPDMINIKDIIYMTSQLDKFVKLYDKCIRETDDEQRYLLNRLEDIANCLKKQQYDYLFEDNIKMIDWDPSNAKFEPGELQAWRDFFKRNPY